MKMFDYICSQCGCERKDVLVDTYEERVECHLCHAAMDKDYSGFKGIHTDSFLRLSAVRKKGKHKAQHRERPKRRSKNK